jgi:hypothetical protein
MSTALALINLRPNSQFRWEGENYSDIQWIDETIAKPTEQEIIAESNRIKAEYVSNEYQRKRATEYPPITDYLDGVVKGDQEQMDKYIADCLAVKAKYPK